MLVRTTFKACVSTQNSPPVVAWVTASVTKAANASADRGPTCNVRPGAAVPAGTGRAVSTPTLPLPPIEGEVEHDSTYSSLDSVA